MDVTIHKTMFASARRFRFLNLAAPRIGVHGGDWVSAWWCLLVAEWNISQPIAWRARCFFLQLRGDTLTKIGVPWDIMRIHSSLRMFTLEMHKLVTAVVGQIDWGNPWQGLSSRWEQSWTPFMRQAAKNRWRCYSRLWGERLVLDRRSKVDRGKHGASIDRQEDESEGSDGESGSHIATDSSSDSSSGDEKERALVPRQFLPPVEPEGRSFVRHVKSKMHHYLANGMQNVLVCGRSNVTVWEGHKSEVWFRSVSLLSGVFGKNQNSSLMLT